MKFYILIVTLISFLSSQDLENKETNLFITNYEYGQMLYKNPRGIGCIKCHGESGNSKFISSYLHKDKEYKITSPKINNLSLSKFIKVLKKTSTSKAIMPTYFLTNDEMKQIHFYITNKQKYD